VPSRIHPGEFYALPQAPQQFKQLLMVAGLDKYFQIAPCFRDEDPRADRHPGEFYQLDFEMSFIEQEDVFSVAEPLMIELTEKFSGKKIVAKPFPRLTWREAMSKYGSDKPDLRFGLEIFDVSDVVKESDFKVFADVLANRGVVHALRVPGGADFSRKDIDMFTEEVKKQGAKGLAYILITKEGPTSPIIKYLGDGVTQKVIKELNAEGLKDPTKAAWCWVVDFPMYEFNEEEGKIDFSHNPFSMPQGGLEALKTKDPLEILGFQYDLVLNGFEMASGAIRNHEPETMYKAFEIAGYSKEEVDAKFGAMIAAFKFGAPPHGGMAPGLDRLFMVLQDVGSIRDVYAFPKNGRAQDALMGAPSQVSERQLKELSLAIILNK
jgi:aspartyl-tRNA synthetase